MRFEVDGTVRVLPGTGPRKRLGEVATVRRVIPIETVEDVVAHNAAIGTNVLTIEYADGTLANVPEHWVEHGELDVDEVLAAFRELISSAWPSVERAQKVATSEHFVEDWLQATWEMIVETALGRTYPFSLPRYGDGADLNGLSDRVYMPDAEPTHFIVCVARDGGSLRDLLSGEAIDAPDGAELGELVTMVGTWYERQPPFDCVLIEGSDRKVVRVSDVRFELRPSVLDP